ncbi:MAG: type IV pilin protein [Steroidobacteraceae bacterium]
MRNRQQGITLLELMVVVAIVAILAAIAYPSYRNQILRSHRAEAKAALLQVQVAQEKFFLQNNSYASALNAANLGLGYSSTTPGTTNNYYQLSLSNFTATTYTITATAQNGQADDAHCATFTIDQTGSRGGTNSDCW